MARNPYSKAREDLITKQSDKLNAQINRAQNKFFKLINDGLLSSLPTDENGVLKMDMNSHFLPSKFDDFYDQFSEDEIKPVIGSFSKGIKKLLTANADYFDSIDPNGKHEETKASVLGTLGVSGAVLVGGSLLYSILSDRAAIQAVKSIVMSSISAGLTLPMLRTAVEEVVLRRGGGLLKNLFEEKLPDPYVKIDRFIGQKYATDLQLNYAIYQGGTIGTSRDFCIERNNKVFSRDEILKFGTPNDRFGGYTDKSLGEFQGKTDPYDPLTDCGGYNCRHSWDHISDELAFHLRPELKGRS
jgi:hypothetical protein